jgi:hypothetical protein
MDPNSRAELAATFRRTRPAYQGHEAKANLKELVPEGAEEAMGPGIRAKRSKFGSITFDLLDVEAVAVAAAPYQRAEAGGA